jgi:glutamate carboxypeptidase
MTELSPAERAMLTPIDPAPMRDQVLAWSAINTGTRNLDGLARQAGLLATAFAALPGEVRLEDPAPVEAVAPDGHTFALAHGQHLVLRVRPQANRRLVLTGHMDTVFAPDHAFQATRWLDADTLNGPGVADMKGGIAVMLAALTAFERSPAASGVGYDVLINADEETGSLSSAPLIARLAMGKAAALTFEPSALPDGTLAGARAGSGNYSVVIHGRSAHAGRNPHEGRNAIVADRRSRSTPQKSRADRPTMSCPTWRSCGSTFARAANRPRRNLHWPCPTRSRRWQDNTMSMPISTAAFRARQSR